MAKNEQNVKQYSTQVYQVQEEERKLTGKGFYDLSEFDLKLDEGEEEGFGGESDSEKYSDDFEVDEDEL